MQISKRMKVYSKKIKLSITAIAILFICNACFNDLDTVPIDPDEVTSEVVYDNPAAYRQVLAKVYAGLALSGQQGPSGQADIAGIDEGFGQYLRALWYHQEFPTEEAVVGWADQTIKDFHEQDWDANDVFISAFYSRIFYQIPLANEFLRETTDEKLSSRNVDENLKSEIQGYRAEVRFLRALSYWHALDHFRNVPFITEANEVGAFFPEQIEAKELFDYLVSELTEIMSELPPARMNEYGRTDQGAAWMLLAKLYLNAEVYTGESKYTECVEACNKVMEGGYTLEPEYQHLFLADNHVTNEFIFPIVFDGVNTRTWGGMTFIIRAGIGGNMPALESGVESGWGGTRTTSGLVNKFPSVVGTGGGGLIVSPAEGMEYPFVYIPGSYQGWDPADNTTILSSINDDGNYEGYVYFPEDGGQFKVTPEPSWAINYGDTDEDGIMEVNGRNIQVGEKGMYRVTFNINDLSYSLTKTEWGLIGSATSGGWDNDLDMEYDAEDGSFVIITALNTGDIKFRANDEWDIDFGDTGADALLDAGGENIKIERGGVYEIRLYLDHPDYTYSIASSSSDSRAIFYTDGQNLEIEDIGQFTEGYAVTKFKNVDRFGNSGSDIGFPDTDFPLFRLADTYLMYAEAVLRGGTGGDMNTALELVNRVVTRAYQEEAAAIPMSELNLDFILDERARELFWECHRRTDLVRFGQFTNGDYVWPWKGGVPEGRAVDSKFDVYPIPTSDITANPKLRQNSGY